jgi:cytidylate kinase
VGTGDGGGIGVIVTISRQAASRGEQVAQVVAQRLGVPLVDPETVHRAAVRIDLQKENLADPQRAERLGERLAHLAVLLAAEPPEDIGWVLTPVPSSMEDAGYRRAVESMLRALSESGNVVIAGFPAQVLLAKAPRAVHALVVAPLPLRVQRMVLREDLPFRTAERVLRDADRDRTEFYRRLYNVAWDDPTLYDSVLNTARLGVDQAARVILGAVRSRGE